MSTSHGSIRSFLRFALPLASLYTIACGNSIPAATYNVTASFANTADVPHNETLNINYTGGAAAGTRLVFNEGMPFTYLQTVSLTLTRTGFPNTDAYVLQVMSEPSTYISDDDPDDGTLARTGDWGFIGPRTSDIFALALQPSNVGDGMSVTANLDPRRTSVMAWLATIDENDFELPYFVAPGSTNCTTIPRPDGSTDCLDVQTIAFALLDGMVDTLTKTVDPPASGGSDPNLLVRVRGTPSAVSWFPNLVNSALNDGTRRTRGIGFILQVSFEARAEGRIIAGQDVGTPYHPVTAYIPIGMHFEDDGEGGVRITMDPLDLPGTPAAQMTSRIAVAVSNPVGSPVDQAAGNAIASSVLATMTAAMGSPPAALVNTLSNLLGGFFNARRPARRFPANFDVMLMADGGQGTPQSVLLSRAPGASGPRLIFLE